MYYCSFNVTTGKNIRFASLFKLSILLIVEFNLYGALKFNVESHSIVLYCSACTVLPCIVLIYGICNVMRVCHLEG